MLPSDEKDYGLIKKNLTTLQEVKMQLIGRNHEKVEDRG